MKRGEGSLNWAGYRLIIFRMSLLFTILSDNLYENPTQQDWHVDFFLIKLRHYKVAAKFERVHSF